MPADGDLVHHPSSDGEGDELRRGKPTMKEVAACFHLPIEVAAKELGVGQTWLKLLCRSNGVSRWPFRKIQSLQNSLDRSKKMQSLVEVAKVINKNLPKWLDLEGDKPQVDIPHEAAGGHALEDDEEEDQRSETDRSCRSAAEPLHEVLRPGPPGAAPWKMPPKRNEEYELQIKVLEQDRGGELANHAPSTTAEDPAVLSDSSAATQTQWQKVLQEAVSKQQASEPVERTYSGSAFGSKNGGAFRPVPQKATAPAVARMPAPIDFSHFYQLPTTAATPLQLMPFFSEQFPAAFATAIASQGRALNPLALAPTPGLEQLLAVAASQPAALPKEHVTELRRA